MANTITVTEADVNILTPTWTGIRLERGPNSTNLGAFTIAALIPYVFGQTTYTVVDPAGAPSDWYRAVRYGPLGLLGTYSPPWPTTPVPITLGDGSRRSRKNCRRMLARRLQSLQVATCSADGNAFGTTFQSAQLATQLDGNRYRGWWAMPTDGVSAGLIRVVGDNALNPSDGTITVLPAYTSQIVRGTEVEMHKQLPPDELGGLLGLNQALNLALAECWVWSREALVGVSGTASYDISALGDWLDPDAIVEFLGPIFASSILPQPWGGYTARRDSERVLLDVAPGIASGAALSVELTRPGDSYIRMNGVWTDQQQGFVNDDDECLFQPAFLVQIALAHCYEAMRDTVTGTPQKQWAAMADAQRTKANLLKYRSLPHPAERSSHPPFAFGPGDWMGYLK